MSFLPGRYPHGFHSPDEVGTHAPSVSEAQISGATALFSGRRTGDETVNGADAPPSGEPWVVVVPYAHGGCGASQPKDSRVYPGATPNNHSWLRNRIPAVLWDVHLQNPWPFICRMRRSICTPHEAASLSPKSVDIHCSNPSHSAQ